MHPEQATPCMQCCLLWVPRICSFHRRLHLLKAKSLSLARRLGREAMWGQSPVLKSFLVDEGLLDQGTTAVFSRQFKHQNQVCISFKISNLFG